MTMQREQLARVLYEAWAKLRLEIDGYYEPTWRSLPDSRRQHWLEAAHQIIAIETPHLAA